MMHIRPDVRLTLAGRAASARVDGFSAPGLPFKNVHDREPIDSVRVTANTVLLDFSRTMASRGSGLEATLITTAF